MLTIALAASGLVLPTPVPFTASPPASYAVSATSAPVVAGGQQVLFPTTNLMGSSITSFSDELDKQAELQAQADAAIDARVRAGGIINSSAPTHG